MDTIVKTLKKIFPFEIIVLVTTVLIINIIKYPDDIGFLSIHYNPYLFVLIFFTSFYGKKSGLLTFFITTIMIVSYILISDLYYSTDILYSTITTPATYQQLSSLLFLSLIIIIIRVY
ncbi:MAG: hypothetical protein WBK20_09435 [Spirochaetota bacterium]